MIYPFTAQSQYRLAQITDCHLVADIDGSYKQVKPAAHLAAIVRSLVADSPDAVLLTGDVTQDHSNESYQLLAELMAPLICPVFCLPGNHDDVGQLTALCQQRPFRPERNLQLSGWQLLLLSSKGDTPAGVFLPTEQQWLTAQCQRSVQPAIWLFCHHHPLPLNCFIDKHGQQHQAALWQAIANEPRIRGIAHGHAHYAYQRQWQQVDIVGCPASSVQFLPTADWQTSNAGPQWCDWLFSANGTVRWQFRRLDIM
ncbi:metallophosphoesterase [Rheinheimera sp.]|uniref:metallophosphoesterase n=1 Tax=Rheinheimera sp. TaxID=1869214 RepID=UPI00404845E7